MANGVGPVAGNVGKGTRPQGTPASPITGKSPVKGVGR